MPRLIAPVLVGVLIGCTGCLTAVRRIEQAVRRGSSETGDERPAKREPTNVPAAFAPDTLKVRPGHPRLFVAADWPAATDDVAKDFRAKLRKRADISANDPLVAYSSNKLLTRSRDALKKISLYAGVYRFTGDKTYADRGKRELLNVCDFPDWQPDNFLATSEMMTAAAIGYDWLHDTLTPAERKRVADAIVEKGLTPALDAYDSQGGWTRAQHNWNLVCNGGVIVASLAVAEEQPKVAQRTLRLALDSIRFGLGAYDENGGTVEGPMYHSYATRYLTFAAAAFDTAVEDGGGLFSWQVGAPYAPDDRSKGAAYDLPNRDRRDWMFASKYRLHITGPSGRVANFGDGNEILGNTSWVLWIAGRTHDDTATKFQAAADREDPSIFDLLWYDPTPNSYTQNNTPRTKIEPAMQFASAITLRSPDGQTFAAMRVGGTADHHSHLDLGSFVLDMQGQRFAQDLGADNYGLPGYLGPRRADYLRSSTPGHNTLTVDNASQPGDVSARHAKASVDGDKRIAYADLTEAYPGFRKVTRTLTVDAAAVTVRDVLAAKREAVVYWHLHTPAAVRIDGASAVLDADGKRVRMTVVSPKNATLSAGPDETKPPQQPVEGSTHVRVRVKVGGHDKDDAIEVKFVPETP